MAVLGKGEKREVKRRGKGKEIEMPITRKDERERIKEKEK